MDAVRHHFAREKLQPDSSKWPGGVLGDSDVDGLLHCWHDPVNLHVPRHLRRIHDRLAHRARPKEYALEGV